MNSCPRPPFFHTCSTGLSPITQDDGRLSKTNGQSSGPYAPTLSSQDSFESQTPKCKRSLSEPTCHMRGAPLDTGLRGCTPGACGMGQVDSEPGPGGEGYRTGSQQTGPHYPVPCSKRLSAIHSQELSPTCSHPKPPEPLTPVCSCPKCRFLLGSPLPLCALTNLGPVQQAWTCLELSSRFQ